MFGAFGIYGSVVGAGVVLWMFIVGFWVKAILKEVKETNQILRQSAGSGAKAETKVA